MTPLSHKGALCRRQEGWGGGGGGEGEHERGISPLSFAGRERGIGGFPTRKLSLDAILLYSQCGFWLRICVKFRKHFRGNRSNFSQFK